MKPLGLTDCLHLGTSVYQCDTLLARRRLLVFYVCCLLKHRALQEQCRFFSQTALRRSMFFHTPYFVDQTLRQVFYKGSTPEERKNRIQAHIQVMEELFRPDVLKTLYVDCHRILLWQDEYDGKPLTLYLVFREGQQKEGCLSIELIYDSLDLEHTGWDYGKHVYQIMFSLGINDAGERIIHVGALQGLAGGREFIKGLTKAFFGYRTKNLIVWCLRCMAAALDVTHIYAVSNEGYYAMNHYRRDRKLKVDLNAFWQECGGAIYQHDNRFYEIPIAEKCKKMEELKPSKRAMHRRRFAKMDEIQDTIAAQLKKLEK